MQNFFVLAAPVQGQGHKGWLKAWAFNLCLVHIFLTFHIFFKLKGNIKLHWDSVPNPCPSCIDSRSRTSATVLISLVYHYL